ncbi:MAG: SIS domain-containing protein, partial [Anaerolineaceae bacterium]|nr:SIS domain-containing protein [Anaerolineaceae bacterium]
MEIKFNQITLERPEARAKEPSTDQPGDQNRLNRVEKTRTEALKQADAIRETLTLEEEKILALASRIHQRNLDRVYIVGCGDSWHVGNGVRYTMEQILGIPVEPMQALDFTLYYHKNVNEHTLVIGISSGGSTPAVIDGMKEAHARGAFCLGLTNSPGSVITEAFDGSLIIHATRKGWPTQASTATMALICKLTLALGRINKAEGVAELEEGLEKLPQLIEMITPSSDSLMEKLAQKLAYARFLFFTGGGSNLAAAAMGGAKVKELCPIHAATLPLEEFHHYRSLKPGDPLFIVAPDKASHQRAVDTAEVGRYDGGL